MPQLRLMTGSPDSNAHAGEIFSCAFTPDGQMLLTGGWDGHLRLWDVSTGAAVTSLRAGPKAISACGVAPNGEHLVSGSLEGIVVCWDVTSHASLATFVLHTRPVSAIRWAPDGQAVATASWDRSAVLWTRLREREGRMLTGHEDIVAGCRFTPDGSRLVTWSHDTTLRVWEAASGRCLATLSGHLDRVTAAGVSPDGRWLASGARDRVLKLWNLQTLREERSLCLAGEVRACLFLLDGESLVTVDGEGRVVVHELPDLHERAELLTRTRLQCAELAPGGDRIGLGCDDGRVRFVGVEGLEATPLVVTPTQTTHQTKARFGGLFGKAQQTKAFRLACPLCRHDFELTGLALGQTACCPSCRRALRLSPTAPAQTAAV